jgi:hypothetical protein
LAQSGHSAFGQSRLWPGCAHVGHTTALVGWSKADIPARWIINTGQAGSAGARLVDKVSRNQATAINNLPESVPNVRPAMSSAYALTLRAAPRFAQASNRAGMFG